VTLFSRSHRPVLRVLAGVADDRQPTFSRDSAGFDRFYAAYHRRVYGYLFRMIRHRDGTDDVFQEAWLRVARHWRQEGAVEDIEAWVFTIAGNTLLSHRRSDATKGRTTQELGGLAPAPSPVPDQVVEATQGLDRIERAFDLLAEDDREVLWLLAVEGLRQDQIANLLRLSHAAARQRITRARARLAERLRRMEEAPVLPSAGCRSQKGGG